MNTNPQRKKLKTQKALMLPGIYYSFELKIGTWKNMFEEDKYKFLIAAALNASVNEKKKGFNLIIKGYLITRKRVCLILEIKPDQIDVMFDFFYDWLRREIRHDVHKRKEQYDFEKSFVNHEDDHLHYHLFEKKRLYNRELINVLTREPLDSDFYFPGMERLKKYLHNYNFCSIIDYKGGVSSVKVTLALHNKYSD